MITNFNDFSSVISIKLDNDLLYFRLKYDDKKLPFEVQLYVNNELYENLSIIIPDSKKLDHMEFFLNPNVNTKIIEALEKENFIQKTGKESIAGDKKTISYSL